MATYAIGDVQGCFDELKELLALINFNSDRDQLWFCGDLVNRGPKSLETLRFIKSLEDNAITVLGNHDLHLLATAYDHQKPGKKDTLNSILQADDCNQLMDWLRHQHMMFHDEDKNITLLHAGLHPDWSIKQALQLAGEIEDVLRGTHHLNFYKHMYGDKPFIWDNALTGWQRYRFITNMLTRLRYCDSDGKPALSAKGAPGTQAEYLHPWYETPNRKSKKDTIIFGHWSTLPHAGKSSCNNTYPIDSGCLWGGKLTAMRIDERPFQYIQLQCPGAQKPPAKYLKSTKSKKKST
ncbi:Bis(5'-nucleosyl)-tetraphosphatase, symmetrical [hydrothermal vent metagenome]|uniref:bis(5'-nucleosyl)-tetraphosphatase (symmetrical) n=1 Tax=hydrothermal vent metagenome TaxID=652676 RepID=A0A3B0WFR5_9ZZZZ